MGKTYLQPQLCVCASVSLSEQGEGVTKGYCILLGTKGSQELSLSLCAELSSTSAPTRQRLLDDVTWQTNMTDKWGLVKLLNAARVTRACQRLLKKKKKEKTNNNKDFDKLLSIQHANAHRRVRAVLVSGFVCPSFGFNSVLQVGTPRFGVCLLLVLHRQQSLIKIFARALPQRASIKKGSL